MKILKKLTAAAVAAALMALACAAAVVTGLDQRLMDFLGAQPAQETLLSPYALPLDITVEDSGATLRVRQVLKDRYTIMILVDFIMPEGSSPEEIHQFRGQEKRFFFLDKNGGRIYPGSNASQWFCLERSEEERRSTFLFRMRYVSPIDSEADTFQFFVRDPWNGDGGEHTLLTGDWSCVIPVPADSGWVSASPLVYQDRGGRGRITELYLSPMTLHITAEWDSADSRTGQWDPDITLSDREGVSAGALSELWTEYPHGASLTALIPEIIDPAQFQGGTLTINGADIPLENLVPAAK